MNAQFSDIGSAIEDVRFPDVDLALRRGRHIDREDADWYAYLLEAQGVLESFYRRFDCELVYRSDGYFFLLPTGDKLSRRQLSIPEMLVGQGIALLYLDPRTVEGGGVVTRDAVIGHLAAVMGTDALVHAFSTGKRKRIDERVAQEAVRTRVAEALRKLAGLGFVDWLDGDNLRLRSALMRFAEPVRGTENPESALEKLVASGEITLGSAQEEGDPEHEDGELSETDLSETEPSETEPSETEPSNVDELASTNDVLPLPDVPAVAKTPKVRTPRTPAKGHDERPTAAPAPQPEQDAAEPDSDDSQADDLDADGPGGFDAWGLEEDFSPDPTYSSSATVAEGESAPKPSAPAVMTEWDPGADAPVDPAPKKRRRKP